MKKAAGIRILFAGVLLIIFSIVLISQAAAKPLPIMKLSEVKKGMEGTARTVIKGTKISEFKIEVIDIAKMPEEYGMSGNVILVRAKGDIIEKTGGFASGMSGSPVIIDDKIVGAVAFGMEPFADAAIAGVTPIEAMLEVGPTPIEDRPEPPAPGPGPGPEPEPGPGPEPLPDEIEPGSGITKLSQDIKVSSNAFPQLSLVATADEAVSKSKENPGVQFLYPLQTSISCSGITNVRTQRELQRKLSEYNIKLMPGSARSNQQAQSLEPGSSIGVGLITGDVSIGTIGTLTYLDDDKFWAFGHSFFYWGDVAFPLTGSIINDVVKSLAVPFKMGSIQNTVGLVSADRGAGISGITGRGPGMVKAVSTVTDKGRDRSLTLNSEIVTDSRLLESLSWVPSTETYDRVLDQMVSGTSKVRISVTARGLEGTLVRENMFFSNEDVAFSSNPEIMDAVTTLLSNRFKEVIITKITTEADVTRERKTALIEGIKVLGESPKAGETMRVEVTYIPWAGKNRYSGPSRKAVANINIPAVFPPGPAMVTVSQTNLGGEFPEGPITESSKAKNLQELVKEFENQRKNNEIEIEVVPEVVVEPELALEPSAPDMLPTAKGKVEIDSVVEFLEGQEVMSVSTTIGKATWFTDVKQGYWAYDSIYYLQRIDAVDGYTDGTFRPNAGISRQELASLLSKAANLTPIDKPKKSFSDVSVGNWAFSQINSAVKAGYMEGTSSTSFNPKGIATRAQVIKSVVSFSGYDSTVKKLTDEGASKVLSKYTDEKKVPGWVKKYMATAILRGFVSGYPDGSLKPDKPITRAEVAKLLAMVSKNTAD